jgi:hypothetical protein
MGKIPGIEGRRDRASLRQMLSTGEGDKQKNTNCFPK